MLERLSERLCGLAASGTGSGLETVRLADVESRPVAWLWPNRVALGKLTLLIGDPDLGKSTVALDLAARVSRGGAWPDGPGALAPGRVLIATAEDGLEDTIRPRVEAAGADLGLVEAIRAVRTPEGPRPLSLELDLARLESKVAAMEGLRLLLIDPLSAFLGATESHRDADVRRVLTPLAAMAERHGVAVLGILHLNKGQSKALYRAMGSVAFVAAARAVWLVARDPANRERRFLVPVKNNLGTAPALAFGLEAAPGPAGTTVPRIAWEAQPVDVTADEVLGPPAETERESARGRACSWLREELASGPLAATDVLARAGEADISKRTLDRAKEDLGVESFKRAVAGPWFWKLPEVRQPSIPENLATFGGPGGLRPGEAENGHPSAHGDPAEREDRQAAGLAPFGATVPLVLAPGAGPGCGPENLR